MGFFKNVMVEGTHNMPRNHRREAEVCLYPFTTSALKGSGWSTACPGCCTPGHRPSTQWTGCWVGLGLLWKGKENLSSHWGLNPGLTESRYWLHYPNHLSRM